MADLSLWDQGGDSGGSMPWRSWADSLDPTNSRSSSWSDWASPPQYDYGQPYHPGVNFDPLPRGQPFDPISKLTSGVDTADQGIDAWMRRAHPELFQFSDPSQATNPGVVGNPTDPDWAGVNSWNTQIEDAVQKVAAATGVYVPPNVVKSIMQIESGGVMLAPNKDGAVGLMQLTQNTMGNYDYGQLSSDPAYNIWAGVNDIALRMQGAQAQLGDQANWGNAIVGYFSGHYVPIGSSDGHDTDYQYLDQFNQNMNTLGNATSGGVGGTTAPAGTKQFGAIWGGFDAPITQGFGFTDFSQGNSEYDYGKDYSRDGKPMGHPGVDVGVSYGTKLYIPVGGTVQIAGGTPYYTTTASGDPGDTPYQADGTGELMVVMPNQDEIILGHMSQITVRPGQTVNPGDFVGFSGANNGAHVHVEYRKYWGPPGTVTTSGYEVIDPRLALQGVFSGTFGQTNQTGPALVANAGGDWQSFMRAAASGQPFTGSYAGGVGGLHDWIKQALHIGGGLATQQPKAAGPPSGWTWDTGTPPAAQPPVG